MDAEAINAALSDDSFNFSEIDDDIIDPDFILGEPNTEIINNLFGIHPLISSDSEQDENVRECNVVESVEECVQNVENVESNDLVTLNVVNDETNENDDQEDCLTFKEKKRVATPSLWKRNITKLKRAAGEEGVSCRGIINISKFDF